MLDTNTATAVALLVWTVLDKVAYGKPSVLGAVNGMIAGLVASLTQGRQAFFAIWPLGSPCRPARGLAC